MQLTAKFQIDEQLQSSKLAGRAELEDDTARHAGHNGQCSKPCKQPESLTYNKQYLAGKSHTNTNQNCASRCMAVSGSRNNSNSKSGLQSRCDLTSYRLHGQAVKVSLCRRQEGNRSGKPGMQSSLDLTPCR